MDNTYYISNTKEPKDPNLILDNTVSTDMYNGLCWYPKDNPDWWIRRKIGTTYMYYEAGYSFAFSD